MHMYTLKNKTLYIVVPCFNEQEVLPITSKYFIDKLNAVVKKYELSSESKLLFINDGSADDTWIIIKNLSEKYDVVKGVSLSNNVGHQNALLAGLYESKELCDICISIDCDGQDDINAIDDMLYEYSKGNDIVYGVRCDRGSDSWIKRVTAEMYYKFLNAMGAKTIYNHADYRLVSKKVLISLFKFNESNLYLRGIFPLIGYKHSIVTYKRFKRANGNSHYTLKKMIDLALNGITNLSVKPLRLIFIIGLLFVISSLVVFLSLFIRSLTGIVASRDTLFLSVICFLFGIQLTSLGVIGEYIGKIYIETKNRPKFIIEEKTY